jgi:hypothetical protein
VALKEYAVDLLVRLWVMNANAEQAQFDIQRTIKERFNKAGITVPARCQIAGAQGGLALQSTAQPNLSFEVDSRDCGGTFVDGHLKPTAAGSILNGFHLLAARVLEQTNRITALQRLENRP